MSQLELAKIEIQPIESLKLENNNDLTIVDVYKDIPKDVVNQGNYHEAQPFNHEEQFKYVGEPPYKLPANETIVMEEPIKTPESSEDPDVVIFTFNEDGTVDEKAFKPSEPIVIEPDEIKEKPIFKFMNQEHLKMLDYKPFKFPTVEPDEEDLDLLRKDHEKDSMYEWFVYSEDLTLLRDKRNGMYQAASIVKMIAPEKKDNAGKWFTANKDAQELFKGFVEHGNYQMYQLYYKQGSGLQDFRGWWINELLIEHYAMWLSPAYAYKVALLLKKIREQERNNLAKVAKKYEDKMVLALKTTEALTKYAEQQENTIAMKNNVIEQQCISLKKEHDKANQIQEEYNMKIKEFILKEKQIENQNIQIEKQNKEITEQYKKLADKQKTIESQRKEIEDKSVNCEVKSGPLIILQDMVKKNKYQLVVTTRFQKGSGKIVFHGIYTSPHNIRKSLFHERGLLYSTTNQYFLVKDIDKVMDVLLKEYKPKEIIVNRYIPPRNEDEESDTGSAFTIDDEYESDEDYDDGFTYMD